MLVEITRFIFTYLFYGKILHTDETGIRIEKEKNYGRIIIIKLYYII